MPGRTFNPTGTEFGFNGKRKDNEMYGEGNAMDFDARIYDPRLGRWMRTDQLFYKYSGLSPYHFAYNSPISFIDVNGKDIFLYDMKGNLVTWVQIKDHSDIAFQMNNFVIPDNWEGPNVINLDKMLDKAGANNPFVSAIRNTQPDAIGVGVGVDADLPLVQIGYSMEAIFFLEGPNQFETHYFGTVTAEAGSNSQGLDMPEEFIGAQMYFVLGYNNTGVKDKFTTELWEGNEESYHIAFPEVGGLEFEWSNDSDAPTLYPDFRKDSPNHVNQFEINITPPLTEQGGGISYSAGSVGQMKIVEDILKTPDKLVNQMFEIKRLTPKEHKQLKANNLKRQTEVSIGKSQPRLRYE